MASYWKRVLEARPEWIDRTVYFSPTKRTNLACRINSDGTLSPVTAPELRFDSATKMAEAWKKGQFVSETGARLPRRHKLTKISFSSDFFLQPGRRTAVKILLQKIKVPVGGNGQVAAAQPVVPMQDPVGNGNNQPVAFAAPVDNGNVQSSSRTDLSAVPASSSAPVGLEPQKRRCPGFDRHLHQQVLTDRQWDGARIEFSPVIMSANRCWSKECVGDIAHYMKRCYDCKMAQTRLYRLRNKRPVHSETSRILHTPLQWLTTEEKVKRQNYLSKAAAEKLQSQINAVAEKLKKKTREVRSLKRTISAFRPSDIKSQDAVRNVVKSMNTEQQKIQFPVCQWLVNETEICGHSAVSIQSLRRHVNQSHLEPERGSQEVEAAAENSYNCKWKGCTRSAPFGMFDYLRKHVSRHTGDEKTITRLSLLQEQMINSGKQPSGRRYNTEVKQTIVNQFGGARSWNRARNLAQLTLPTARTVAGWKNNGGSGRESEIEQTILDVIASVRMDA